MRGSSRNQVPLAAVLAGAIAGCATGPEGATAGTTSGTTAAGPAVVEPGPVSPEAGPRGAPDETEPGLQTEALAAQADRDVEQWLAMRRGDGAADPADHEASAGSVVWNDAARGSATASRRSRPRTAPRPDPTPADPPIAQSPLFMDPPEAIALETPPDSAPLDSAPLDSAPLDPATAGTPAVLTTEQIDLLLVSLRRQLYQKSIDSDQPLRELLAIASMALVDPDLILPDGVERELTAEELSLLEKLHDFFTELGRELGDEKPAEETILNALLQLQKAAFVEPQLELPTAALCWRVGGFGDFEAFDRNAFLAHGEQQFILYLEIDGFASELNPRSQWVTEVSQQLEIYSDSDGIPVWSEPWQKAVDVTNNRRRDFFTTQIITVPKALSVGRYHLKIRVRDEKSGAEAEASLPFEMVADPKLAGRLPS